MENIFKDTYFGKPYKTRDGRKALYHSYFNLYPECPFVQHHNLILEEKDKERDSYWVCANDYGHTFEHVEGAWLEERGIDIVSEWKDE